MSATVDVAAAHDGRGIDARIDGRFVRAIIRDTGEVRPFGVAPADDVPTGVPSGALLRTMAGHTDGVTAVSFAEATDDDGTARLVVVSSSFDRDVRLWDAAAGECIDTLEGHDDAISAVQVDPVNGLIASGGFDRTCAVWDGTAGERVATLSGMPDNVRAVAFSPDGRFLAVAAASRGIDHRDRALRVFSAETFGEVCSLPGAHPKGAIAAVAFSPRDSAVLASVGADGALAVSSITTGDVTLRTEIGGGWLSAVAFFPDGTAVCVGGAETVLHILDTSSGQDLALLEGHKRWVKAVAVHPEGKLVVSAADDTSGVRLWDIATKATLITLTAAAPVTVTALTFSPNGDVLAAAAGNDVVLWETSPAPVEDTFECHEDTVTAAAFSADGFALATGAADTTVKVWDVETGRLRRTLAAGSAAISNVALSDDGALAVAIDADGVFRFWHVASGEQWADPIDVPADVRALTFSPDAGTVAAAATLGDGSDATLLIELRQGYGKLRHSLPTPRGERSHRAAFSPDSTVVAIARPGGVDLWDTATGAAPAPSTEPRAEAAPLKVEWITPSSFVAHTTDTRDIRALSATPGLSGRASRRGSFARAHSATPGRRSSDHDPRPSPPVGQPRRGSFRRPSPFAAEDPLNETQGQVLLHELEAQAERLRAELHCATARCAQLEADLVPLQRRWAAIDGTAAVTDTESANSNGHMRPPAVYVAVPDALLEGSVLDFRDKAAAMAGTTAADCDVSLIGVDGTLRHPEADDDLRLPGVTCVASVVRRAPLSKPATDAPSYCGSVPALRMMMFTPPELRGADSGDSLPPPATADQFRGDKASSWLLGAAVSTLAVFNAPGAAASETEESARTLRRTLSDPSPPQRTVDQALQGLRVAPHWRAFLEATLRVDPSERWGGPEALQHLEWASPPAPTGLEHLISIGKMDPPRPPRRAPSASGGAGHRQSFRRTSAPAPH